MSAAAAKSPQSAPVLRVEGVRKRFGELQAVAVVDLQIERGEFFALLGPNGAGKTTLVEMVEGIQTPDEGRIEILGLNWREHDRELRRRIGVALQETHFHEKLTARETLELFCSFYDRPRSRVDEALALTGLTDKARGYAMRLSGGQRQRLALAVALLNEPELLLLDEPTTGLDPNARRELWQILLELKSRGVTMILTTHYMEEAEVLCDRIAIMDRGRVLARGGLEQLISEHDGGDMLEFAAPQDFAPLQQLPGLLRIERLARGRIRVVVRDQREALPELWRLYGRQSEALRNLVCRRMNLDDLFTAMTGRSLEADSPAPEDAAVQG